MKDLSRTWDVLVVGGGNAALCAAITAREAGASVLLLEHAPKAFRGGNSRHTRNFRAMHEKPTDVLTDAYLEDEYWDDLLRVTGGNTDEQLARMTIRASAGVFGWMRQSGVRFQPSLDRHAEPVAHQRLLPRRRQGAGERLLPDRRAPGRDDPVRHRGARAEDGGRLRALRRHHLSRLSGDRAGARCVVAASGGFQAQPGLDAAVLGRRGGQFRHPRHALCQGPRAEKPARTRASRRSAIPPSSMPWRWMPARRNSTAASRPGWTACRSASW